MEKKATDLADRMKAVLDTNELARSEAEVRRRQRLEEGEKARKTLLDDVAAFGERLGHVAVARSDEAVVLRYNDRSVRFEVAGEGDEVLVSTDAWPASGKHRMRREPLLQERWVLDLERHGRVETLTFYDAGLLELMVNGLGLPKPEDLPEKPMSPRLADALLGRGTAGTTASGRVASVAKPEEAPVPVLPRPRRL